MQPDEFKNIGIGLFGDYWPSELAFRLRLNKNTVKRFASGKMPVPEAVASIMRFWLSGGLNEH